MNEEKHEMILETTHSSGGEEWYCPTCGQRMTITWQPWKKIILELGDIYAAHGGSKGILKIVLQINPESEDHPASAIDPLIENPSLAPWMRWLDSKDWDDFWNEDI